MKTKSVLALLLAALLSASFLTACGADPAEETTPETTAVAVETADATEDLYDENGYLKDDLPTLDYDGNTVTVLYWSDVENQEFDAEEMTGEIVNDAIYERNYGVMERLNMVFSWVGTPGNGGNIDKYLATARDSVTAGDGAYDIFASYSRSIAACAVNGLTRSVQDSQYIDYEKPWWPDNLLEESLINDRLYFLSGDISTNVLHMMYCVYYNRDMLTDYNMEIPTEMALNGTWTVDKLIEMTTDVYQDMNGNGKQDIDADIYGFTTASFHNDGFYTGSALSLVDKDADLILKISDDFYSEKAIDLLAKLGPWEATDSVYVNDGNYEVPFTEGRSLFIINRAHYASKALRDADINYGIVPVPKFDESQQEYRTVMGNPVTLYAVSRDTRQADAAEAVLECLGSLAYRLTTPAIFENNMKVKYSIDDVNAQMYDIVRESISFELGRFFNKYLSDITDIYFRAVIGNQQNWASTSATYQKKLDSQIADIVASFLENEEA